MHMCNLMGRKKNAVEISDLVKVLDNRPLTLDILGTVFSTTKTLGKGAFGEVWLLESTTEEFIAVKTGDVNGDIEVIKDLHARSMCTQFVVDMVFLPGKNPIIIMEALDGTLLDLKNLYPGVLPFALGKSVTVQILRSLVCLRQIGIIFSDVHAGNIAYRCRNNESPLIQLIDIGYAANDQLYYAGSIADNQTLNCIITILALLVPELYLVVIRVLEKGYRQQQWLAVDKKMFSGYITYKSLINYLVESVYIPYLEYKQPPPYLEKILAIAGSL
jgi:serine/threonine protein kinase